MPNNGGKLKGTNFARAALAKLRSNSFLRRASLLGGGAAVGHLFTLAAGPLLTRIYGPDEFGALGLFSSLLSVLAVAVTLQYEISIVIGKNEEEAAYLTFGALLLTLPVSAASGGVLWLLIRTDTLGYGSLPWFAPYLMTTSILFVGCFTTLRYWALRSGQFRWIAQASAVQSAARAILQVVFGFLAFHSAGLLLGETLGRGMGMSRTLRGSWPALKEHARHFDPRRLMDTLWQHRKFPLYSFPSSFLDAVCVGMPLPLLVNLYGVSLGGQYSLVWKAITVPSTLISLAVADTFHSTLASCVRESPERVRRIFRLTSRGLFCAGLAPAILLALWGPSIFGWIFGIRWALAGSIAATIAPWYLAQFVASPLSRVVVVLSGQETKLLWDVLCLVSLAAVFLAARSMGLSPLQTIRLLSVVNTLLYAVYYLMLNSIVLRFDKSRAIAVQPC